MEKKAQTQWVRVSQIFKICGTLHQFDPIIFVYINV